MGYRAPRLSCAPFEPKQNAISTTEHTERYPRSLGTLTERPGRTGRILENGLRCCWDDFAELCRVKKAHFVAFVSRNKPDHFHF